MKEEKHITIKRSSVLLIGVVLSGVGLILVGILIGQTVGERRADHTGRWQQNYDRNFFGREIEHQLDRPKHFLKGHALLGEVLTTDENSITIKDRDDTEQSVLVTDDTIIRNNGDTGSRNDLTTGMQVAVFGRPNDEGQVDARLIRMFSNK